MDTIKIMSLGGLQENGKNLYLVEVYDRIFILDAGMKYPQAQLYGIDMVIPDISYLVENKERVAGIFLSHAHENHIGSVFAILKEFKTNIYASKFTLCLLRENLKENDLNPNEYKLIEVHNKSKLILGELTVRFFDVAHNTFDCLGIVIGTKDGNIIYTSNYTFDQNTKIDYVTMNQSLTKYAKEGVLALLTESLGATNSINRGTILEFTLRLNKLFTTTNNRILFSIYSSDLLKFQQVSDIALKFNKKIAIYGRKFHNTVSKAISLGYLNMEVPIQLSYKTSPEVLNEKNLVVFVSGEREAPFIALQRMANMVDRVIKIKEEDVICFLTPSSVGLEKVISETLDLVYRKTNNVVTFSSELLQISHANREEIKTMINLTKPKYIIPVTGEYRHQYAVRTIAKCLDYNDEDIIILEQGHVLEFKDGVLQSVKSSIPTADSLIDGKAVGDVGDVVFRDREILASDGVLIIIICVNSKTRKICADIQLDTRGFVYFDESGELLQGIVKEIDKMGEEFLNQKFINWLEYRNQIRTVINRFIYKKTSRSPMIIPTIISVDYDDTTNKKAQNSVSE